MKSSLLQPVRGRDKTDRKVERTVSPVLDIVDRKKTPVVTAVRHTDKIASPMLSRSGAGLHGLTRPKIKIVDKEAFHAVQDLIENHDASFEEEEKKIRRENLIKDFVMILARKADHIEAESKRGLIESLRKCPRIYEVHMAYAVEMRNTSLKNYLFLYLKKAVEKYKYRSKLIKNFARVLERSFKHRFE